MDTFYCVLRKLKQIFLLKYKNSYLDSMSSFIQINGIVASSPYSSNDPKHKASSRCFSEGSKFFSKCALYLLCQSDLSYDWNKCYKLLNNLSTFFSIFTFYFDELEQLPFVLLKCIYRKFNSNNITNMDSGFHVLIASIISPPFKSSKHWEIRNFGS